MQSSECMYIILTKPDAIDLLSQNNVIFRCFYMWKSTVDFDMWKTRVHKIVLLVKYYMHVFRPGMFTKHNASVLIN